MGLFNDAKNEKAGKNANVEEEDIFAVGEEDVVNAEDIDPELLESILEETAEEPKEEPKKAGEKPAPAPANVPEVADRKKSPLLPQMCLKSQTEKNETLQRKTRAALRSSQRVPPSTVPSFPTAHLMLWAPSTVISNASESLPFRERYPEIPWPPKYLSTLRDLKAPSQAKAV